MYYLKNYFIKKYEKSTLSFDIVQRKLVSLKFNYLPKISSSLKL